MEVSINLIKAISSTDFLQDSAISMSEISSELTQLTKPLKLETKAEQENIGQGTVFAAENVSCSPLNVTLYLLFTAARRNVVRFIEFVVQEGKDLRLLRAWGLPGGK